MLNEVFADRTYQEDKTLTSRSQENALIIDPEESIAQVLQMVERQEVTTTTGKQLQLAADTVCIHGDGVTALAFAQKIRESLAAKEIRISADLK